jgi:ParB/RepB/Spo0J family partition protein
MRDTGGALQPVLGVLDADGSGVELILGERRWRAAKLAGLAELEVKLVDRPSAADWMKWNLAENLQRESLSPVETARRVREMLDLTDGGSGRLVWSARSLSEELGKHPRFADECCELLEAPENVLEAVERGEVAQRVAGLVGSLPQAMRERAAGEMVFRALGSPMTVAQARRHVAEVYRRDLRKAAFDGDDVDLVPGAGACGACRWNGGNRDDVHGRAAGSVCLNPACFAQKCAAHAALVARGLEGHGVRVLDADEAARIFEGHSGELRVGCGYVDVRAVPDAYLLREPGAAGGKCWADLMEGEVPVVVAFDGDSMERRLVETKVAVLAVRRGEHAGILKSDADAGLLTVEERELAARRDRAGRAAADKVRLEGGAELLGALGEEGGWGMEWLSALVRAVCERGLQGEDVVWLCRVLEPGDGRVAAPWARLDELMAARVERPEEAMALLVLALHARRLRLEGFGSWAGDDSPMWILCQLAGFDPAQWEARVETKVALAWERAEEEHAAEVAAKKEGGE